MAMQDVTAQSPRYRAQYVGRFAPSPTGPLHIGSLVAALASWLDARAAGGTWLVRMEDLDPPREQPGAAKDIVATLERFAMTSDEPITFQSERHALYDEALRRLRDASAIYACTCSRQSIERNAARRGAALHLKPGVYPGTCRERGHREEHAALRLRVPPEPIVFVDRACGALTQDVLREVGDFVVRRADGLWAYQLAVVVDDEAQGITHVVRGADLLDNTPRQIALQRLLGYRTPQYLHVPIVTNAAGEKLSKQTGARALDTAAPLKELERAWSHLGFESIGADTITDFLHTATELWQARWFSA